VSATSWRASHAGVKTVTGDSPNWEFYDSVRIRGASDSHSILTAYAVYIKAGISYQG
jgi:hypothetical protein